MTSTFYGRRRTRSLQVLESVPGAADVRPERVAGMPYLRIKIRRDAIARHGLDAADVLETVKTIGGKIVGTGRRRKQALAAFRSASSRLTAPTWRPSES